MIGFEAPEIDILISELTSADEREDEVPAAQNEAVTRAGDIWLIGSHKLICADATKAETYAALLGEARAQMVFCDPPYNVRIDGHVSGKGETKHREFAMASGEMSPEAYTAFLAGVFGHLARFSIDGAIHFQCIDWRHIGEMLAAGRDAYSELKNICVWNKTCAGMGSLYRSQHELVLVFKFGAAAHLNNIQLGRVRR